MNNAGALPTEATTENSPSATNPETDKTAVSTPPASNENDLGGLDGKASNSDDGNGNEWGGVPEDGYSMDGIEMPEGYVLDDGVAESLSGICHEMGLSQKAFANIVNKMTPVLDAQQEQMVEQFKQDNLKAFRADKELGGPRAQQTINAANTAYQKLVPEDLQELFMRSGLNTHPSMIKLFYNLSKSLGDDSVFRGGRSSTNSLANFFNNSKMN